MADVSVVIPCFQDAGGLVVCLDGLLAQKDAGSLQIIVVDNGQTPSIQLPETYRERVTLLHEPRPGSYVARNAGIAAATASVVAFTDADCLPMVVWLARALSFFRENPSFDLFAGRVTLFTQTGAPPRTCAELYENHFAFRQEDNVKAGYAVTANLFVRRQVFDRVGAFDPVTYSGGDAEFTRRAVAGGSRLAYCGDSVVKHAMRSDLDELISKVHRIVGGAYRLRHVDAVFQEPFRLKAILKSLVAPLYYVFKFVPHLLRGQMSLANYLKLIYAIHALRLHSVFVRIAYRLKLKSDFVR